MQPRHTTQTRSVRATSTPVLTYYEFRTCNVRRPSELLSVHPSVRPSVRPFISSPNVLLLSNLIDIDLSLRKNLRLFPLFLFLTQHTRCSYCSNTRCACWWILRSFINDRSGILLRNFHFLCSRLVINILPSFLLLGFKPSLHVSVAVVRIVVFNCLFRSQRLIEMPSSLSITLGVGLCRSIVIASP